MGRLRTDNIEWPEQVAVVRRWYQPYMEAAYDDHAERAKELDQLRAIACTFKSRRHCLAEMTLDPPLKRKHGGGDPKQDNNDVVTLSTIHSCKGREWQKVYVLNAIEGAIPSSRAKTQAENEEERRLLYVAMTRAKSELTLTMPWRTSAPGHGWQSNGDAINRRSTFLPDSILPKFKRHTWRANDDEPTDVDDNGTPFDLPARVKARWS